MAKRTIWMVRAGRKGYLFEDFMKNNVVAIGWEEVKSLSKVTSNKEMKEIVRNAYPELKGGKFNMSASQISKFRLDFEIGDYVFYPFKNYLNCINMKIFFTRLFHLLAIPSQSSQKLLHRTHKAKYCIAYKSVGCQSL